MDTSRQQDAPKSPFRGIQPFRFVDRNNYCGREELVTDLAEKIVLYRLVVLFGESGAGKSSLLNAGLIPALVDKGYQPERLRVRPFSDQPLLIERIASGDAPQEFLPSIFTSSPEHHAVNTGTFTLSLSEFNAAIQSAVESQYPVLIIDQFEELFTLFGQGSDRIAVAKEIDLQSQLLYTIAQLAGDRRLKVKIILTIREDFLGKLQILAKQYSQVMDHRVRIGLLTQESAKSTILFPFREPNRFASRFTSDLADQIVEQLGSTNADASVPPTQLQIVCSRLWDTYSLNKPQIGVDEFNAMGQVKGILKEFLTSELKQLDPYREDAVQILGKLVTESNTRDVVSREKIRSLLGNIPGDQFFAILKSLEARRLINQVAQRGTFYLELSSEFLIEPVQKELAELEHKRELETIKQKEAERTRKINEELDRALKEQEQRRRKIIRAYISAGILLVLAVLAFGAFFYALKQQRKAQAALALAEASEKNSRQLRYVANIRLAQQDMLSGYFAGLVQLLDADLPNPASPNQNDLRSFPWYYLWHNAHREQAILSGHSGPINSVAFRPDGKILASSSDDKTIKLWDVATRQNLATLSGHSASVRSVAFSPDGKTLASASDDKTVKLWNLATNQEVGSFAKNSGPVRAVAFSPDGKMVGSASVDGVVNLWKIDTMTELTPIAAGMGRVLTLAFSPDGKTLAAGGEKIVKLWDIVTRKETPLAGHTGYIFSVAFSADGKMLASASSDKYVKLWDLAKRQEQTLKGHLSDVRSVAFSRDGKRLASVSLEGALKLWNVETREIVTTLSGHSLGIFSVAFSKDDIIASGSQDKTAKLWNGSADIEANTLPKQAEGIYSVAISGGEKLAAAVADGTVKVWEIGSGKELVTLSTNAKSAHAVAFSPDGQTIAVGVSGGPLKLWNTNSWQERPSLRSHHSATVRSVAFSRDGKFLASGSDDSKVKLWDVGTGEEVAAFAHQEGVVAVAFSPDAQMLASASYDRTVKLWNLKTRQELATLPGYSQGVLSVAFSLDGRILASGDFDNNVKLWDIETRKELATLTGHSQGVLSVAFAPDGKTLASTGYDNQIKLWDLATRQELASLTGHAHGVFSLAFSLDGKRLASGSFDKTVKLWNAATDVDVDRLRRQ